MSHDTNHGHSKENKTIISFKNSFWLVVIIVGLFVAALNFVQAESKNDEGESKQATEMKAGAESTSENNGTKTEEAPKPAEAAKDTAKGMK